MVLGKLPAPGRPTNLANSRTGAYLAWCGGGCLDFCLSSIISLLSPLSGRRSDIHVYC